MVAAIFLFESGGAHGAVSGHAAWLLRSKSSPSHARYENHKRSAGGSCCGAAAALQGMWGPAVHPNRNSTVYMPPKQNGAPKQQLGTTCVRRLRQGAAVRPPQPQGGCASAAACRPTSPCRSSAAPTLSLLRSTRVAGCSGCGGRGRGGESKGLTGDTGRGRAQRAWAGGGWVPAAAGRAGARLCLPRTCSRCGMGWGWAQPGQGRRGGGAVVMVPARGPSPSPSPSPRILTRSSVDSQAPAPGNPLVAPKPKSEP